MDTPTREESLRSVYGSIDRLCDTRPDALRKQCGSPAFARPRPAPETLARIDDGFTAQTGGQRTATGPAVSFPRTVSTVSTSTLATALAANAARSPFTAPRVLEAGRRRG